MQRLYVSCGPLHMRPACIPPSLTYLSVCSHSPSNLLAHCGAAAATLRELALDEGPPRSLCGLDWAPLVHLTAVTRLCIRGQLPALPRQLAALTWLQDLTLGDGVGAGLAAGLAGAEAGAEAEAEAEVEAATLTSAFSPLAALTSLTELFWSTRAPLPACIGALPALRRFTCRRAGVALARPREGLLPTWLARLHR